LQAIDATATERQHEEGSERSMGMGLLTTRALPWFWPVCVVDLGAFVDWRDRHPARWRR